MPKKNPNQPDDPPGESERFYQSLRDSKAAAQLKRREENARMLEELRPAIETRDALKLVALGTDSEPTGPWPTSSIDVDIATWSGWIVDLGRAWAKYPGIDALDEKPIPDKGPGIDAGRRILARACEGITARALQREIELARDALGPWMKGEEDIRASEVGILAFFRQLNRHFAGCVWNPPRLPNPPADQTGVPAERLFVSRARVAEVLGISEEALRGKIRKGRGGWPAWSLRRPPGQDRTRAGWFIDELKGLSDITAAMLVTLRESPM